MLLTPTTAIMTTPFTHVLQNEFPAIPIEIMDSTHDDDHKASSPRSSLQHNVEIGIQRLQLVNDDGYHQLHPAMNYNQSLPSTSYPLMSSIGSFLRNKGAPASATAPSSLPKMIPSSPSIYTSKKMNNTSLEHFTATSQLRMPMSIKNNRSRLELWYHKQKALLGPNDVTIVNIEKARRDILRRLEIRLRVLSKQQTEDSNNVGNDDASSTIKYKKLATAIERQLFRSATTIQSYADVSTLDTRLRSLLMSKLLQRQLAANKNTTTTATTNNTSTNDDSSSVSSESEQSYHQHQENLRAQVLVKNMGLQRYNTFKQVIREIRHERHLYGSKLGCAQCVGNSCPPSPVRGASTDVSPIDGCYQSSSLPPPMMNFKNDNMPSEVKDLFFESTNVLIDAFERWPIERIAKMDNAMEWDVLLARGKASLIKYHSWKNDTRINNSMNRKNVAPQEEQRHSFVAIEEDTHHDDDGVDDEDLLV